MAGALIGCGASEAGAGSADWSALLGGARDPGSRWGKRAETSATGVQGAAPAVRSLHLGAGPGGKGAALGRLGGPLFAESRCSPSALPRGAKPGIFASKHRPHPPETWTPSPERRRSPHSREQIASFSFRKRLVLVTLSSRGKVLLPYSPLE